MDRAVEIARQVRIPLRIAAKVDRVDKDYFEGVVEPLLRDPLVDFVGELGDGERDEFPGKRLCIALSDRLAGAIWSRND